MTAYTTPTNMIEASKIGIKDILQKPFDEAELMNLVDKYLHFSKKDKSSKPLLKQGKEEFVGSYETMKEIYKKIGIAANNDLCVLIYGETGTGKELIANLIHTNSDKSEHPFIALNCASNHNYLDTKKAHLPVRINNTLVLPNLQGRERFF